MSFSISAASSNDATFDAAPQAKQAPKPSVADEIKQLADQGRSAETIATTVGLPEALVAVELGTTTSTSTSSTTSQAGALLALGARLSVKA